MDTDIFTPLMSVNRSPEMASLLDQLALLAPLRQTVVLEGETGSGRRALACRLHRQAGEGTWLEVDGANPQQSARLPGYLAECIRGTLWLCNLPYLSERSLDALLAYLRGAPSDLRLVLGVTPGQLSELSPPLSAALSALAVPVPALRQRSEDIPVLLQRMALLLAEGRNGQPVRFSAAAVKPLKRYRWPGNLLEMKALCERLNALLPGAVVTAENLPAAFRASQVRPGEFDLLTREIETIRQALEVAEGNKSLAARLLGISRDTLNYRLRKYALL
ncbi:MAG: helix-turn-helix domain-containing protein [Pseudomonadota bacterium]